MTRSSTWPSADRISTGVVDALGAQRADDRKAVTLGQHAVDDQHVVVAVEREREALLAVGRLVRDMADLAKRLDQIVGRVAVVFDDQKAHADTGC